MIGLYQITSSTQWSLPQVPFPRLLGLPFSVASFLDLDVLGLLPLDCIRKVTYFESLLFTTLAPIALGALIYGAATALEARATRGRAREIYATKSYLLLLLSFCVLTACASATASRGGDDFRETPTGKTTNNRRPAHSVLRRRGGSLRFLGAAASRTDPPDDVHDSGRRLLASLAQLRAQPSPGQGWTEVPEPLCGRSIA